MIRTRVARKTNALAVRTAVLPDPVGMVTMPGSGRVVKWAAAAWMAPN